LQHNLFGKNIRTSYHRIRITNTLIWLFGISIFLTSCGNNGQSLTTTENNEQFFTINANSAKKISRVKITNKGSTEIGINLEFNDNSFYTSYEDILSEIIKMPADYSNEPFQRKLWRYIVKNRYSFHPYTDYAWGHSPAVFLNSIGFGYCDDSASLYYILAKKSGYEARVWGLGGHVVAEVWIDDHWEMYDPDLAVYYLNEKRQVVGVEYLASNPQLITMPIDPIIPYAASVSIPTAYTQEVAEIYATTDSNWTGEYYHYQVDFPEYDYPFNLPPNSYLEFPVKLEHPLKSIFDYDVPKYSVMRLMLPKGWAGNIKLPFVILAINGAGTISLNNKLYTINSTEAVKLLDDRINIINQTYIIESLANIEILFLVNDSRFDMSNLYSFNIESIFPKQLEILLTDVSN